MNLKSVFVIFWIGFFGLSADAQDTLKIVNHLHDYQQQINGNPNMQLVEIVKAIPSVILDIRYATKNNFTGVAVYQQARAFARKPVVNALQKIQEKLKKQGLGLKIFDGYRPYAVTVKFWKVTPLAKKAFVANPKAGSRHNRGCAVDLTLVDLKSGKELEMPTPYDSFSEAASPTYQNIDPTQQKNRDFLIKIMENHGFTVFKNEWWHYDFNGWEKFLLMDIPFEKL